MITDDEKQTFLALIAVGHDAGSAARMVNPELTASMFRRLTNETAVHYDAGFAASYLRARAAGSNEQGKRNQDSGQPRTTTLAGHVKAAYLAPEMLDSFIDQVEQGIPLDAGLRDLLTQDLADPDQPSCQPRRRVCPALRRCQGGGLPDLCAAAA